MYWKNWFILSKAQFTFKYSNRLLFDYVFITDNNQININWNIDLSLMAP